MLRQYVSVSQKYTRCCVQLLLLLLSLHQCGDSYYISIIWSLCLVLFFFLYTNIDGFFRLQKNSVVNTNNNIQRFSINLKLDYLLDMEFYIWIFIWIFYMQIQWKKKKSRLFVASGFSLFTCFCAHTHTYKYCDRNYFYYSPHFYTVNTSAEL